MTTRQNTSETIREEGVNVHLAQLLRNRGISARGERRSRERIPDVRADLRSGDLVILECKWEESVSLLESQLDERLAAFPDALGVVGVLYPARLRQEEDTQASLEAATDLRWWVHGSRGNPLPGPRVRTGSVAELADNLRTLPLELEGVDRVAAAADAVGYALEQAALVLGRTEPPPEHGYSYNGNGHNADSLPLTAYGAADRRSRLYWPTATAWHLPKGNSPCSSGR